MFYPGESQGETPTELGAVSRGFLAAGFGLFFLLGLYGSLAVNRSGLSAVASTSTGTRSEGLRIQEEPFVISVPPTEPIRTTRLGPVTYSHDVAKIVADRCQSCHRPGQVAPFSLQTYDQVRAHAAMIREVIEGGKMPPWHADPRYGHFRNDRRLTPRERDTLLSWVDCGMPHGDTPYVSRVSGNGESWSIGKPDVILKMEEAYAVPAQGVVPYQYFRVHTNFHEDKWVQAVEARPGDRSVVHHFIVRIDEPGRTYKHHGQQPYLVGYAPGDVPSVYETGTARKIPAGADLIFAVHYSPTGRPALDRSSVGMIFAREPVRHQALTQGVSQENLHIPPGAANHPVRADFRFRRDSHLLSLQPHMHLRGKSFQYRAVYPDGRSEVLLSIPAYEFGWQSVYRLAEPKPMPRGTHIECLALFDNSSNNPNNPDPSQAVTWGEQSTDEMMVGFIDYYLDQPARLTVAARRSRPSNRPTYRRFRRRRRLMGK